MHFAYGSCTDEADLLRTVESAELVGPALLPGHALRFDVWAPTRGCGAANAVPTSDGRGALPGVLWSIPASSLPLLDDREAHPRVYRRTQLTVVQLGARPVELVAHAVYRAPRGQCLLEPDAHYVGLVRRGLAAVGLGAGHVDAALASFTG